MKTQSYSKTKLVLRDKLYCMIDGLIAHTTLLNKPLPRITLTSAQFQIFTDFNVPDGRGIFQYRNVIIEEGI